MSHLWWLYQEIWYNSTIRTKNISDIELGLGGQRSTWSHGLYRYQNKHYNTDRKDEETYNDRRRDGRIYFILRIKEQNNTPKPS
jgi:hypothetical protein